MPIVKNNLRKDDDPFRGELGMVFHPRGVSTEKSITVGGPGKFFNVPL